MQSTKKAADSKGVIGSFAATLGLGGLAILLTKALGFKVTTDDLGAIKDNGEQIALQWTAWSGMVAGAVGLVGNWFRTTKIAFTGGEDTKSPLKSRGVMGNALAAAAAVAALYQAVNADSPAIKDLVANAQQSWEIIAPAVFALGGALQGIYGRWRAKQAVTL